MFPDVKFIEQFFDNGRRVSAWADCPERCGLGDMSGGAEEEGSDVSDLDLVQCGFRRPDLWLLLRRSSSGVVFCFCARTVGAAL
jgi:hypothetical protein